MLRALQRLLRPSGRIAYTTIHVPPNLPPAARRRARRAGPRAVASRSGQAQLLRSAGFVEIDVLDVTDEFAATARGWLEEADRHADALASLEAPGRFAQRQRERRMLLAAIEDGLLRRGLFSAVKPGGRRRRTLRGGSVPVAAADGARSRLEPGPPTVGSGGVRRPGGAPRLQSGWAG